MEKFKVGDKVVVVRPFMTLGKYKEGDVGEIVDIHVDIWVNFTNMNHEVLVFPEEIKLLEDKEVKDEVKLVNPKKTTEVFSNKEEAIEEVLTNFDFEYVHKAMKLLDWKWVMKDTDELSVPTQSQLVLEANRLIRKTIEELEKSEDSKRITATGGFEVQAEKDEGELYLRLSFVLSEWDNYN